MNRQPFSRPESHVRTRFRNYLPRLEALEERLPPGDAVLGMLAGQLAFGNPVRPRAIGSATELSLLDGSTRLTDQQASSFRVGAFPQAAHGELPGIPSTSVVSAGPAGVTSLAEQWTGRFTGPQAGDDEALTEDPLALLDPFASDTAPSSLKRSAGIEDAIGTFSATTAQAGSLAGESGGSTGRTADGSLGAEPTVSLQPPSPLHQEAWLDQALWVALASQGDTTDGGDGGRNGPGDGGPGVSSLFDSMATVSWANDDSYINYFTPAFVAEGRIGDSVSGGCNNQTFEIAVSRSTAGGHQPGETSNYCWTRSPDQYEFLFQYIPVDNPPGQPNGLAVFWVRQVGATDWTSVSHSSTWLDPLSYDTVFVRTGASLADTWLRLSQLHLSTDNGTTFVPVPYADGSPGPADVRSDGANDKDSLQVTGVDLRHGFVLYGVSDWYWGDKVVPQQSALSFQLKVGSWRDPVLPAYADTVVPGHVGAGAGAAFGADGQDPGGMAMNGANVRYYNGEVYYQSTDLVSASLGNGWGHTRFYANQLGYNADWIGGNKWVVAQMPFLLQVKGEPATYGGPPRVNRLVAVGGPNNMRWFEKQGADTWVGFFFLPETLTHDDANNEYVLADSFGNVTKFHDFKDVVPSWQRGKLKAFFDPAGNPTVIQYAGTQISSITRGTGVSEEVWSYVYVLGADNQQLVAQAEFRRGGNLVRRATYEYYGQASANGAPNDLMRVSTTEETGTVVNRQLYRYQYDPVTKHSLLRLVVEGDNYERAVQAGVDPEFATDVALEPFADHKFAYDALGRVTAHTTQGAGDSSRQDLDARGTFDYADLYVRNRRSLLPYQENHNRWHFKVSEVRPNGSQLTVYANRAGAPMLKVLQAGGQTWRTFYEYDAQGRITLVANPSAVWGQDETRDDLLNNLGGSNYQYIHDTQGFLRGSSYTGAGYLELTWLRHGDQAATVVTQDRYSYVQQSAGGVSIYVLASRRAYRDDLGTDEILTSYAYPLWTNLQPREIRTTLPSVPASENGPGGLQLTFEYLDVYGRQTALIDADGYRHTTDYDPLTGSVSQTAVDADGLNLVTETLLFDVHGRPLVVRDPNGFDTSYVYSEALDSRSVVTFPPAGPASVEFTNRRAGFRDVLTSAQAIEALSRDYLDRAGKVVWNDRYFTRIDAIYDPNGPFGTVNVHFYRTEHAYDFAGRPSLTINAVGTYTQTLYDLIDRPTQTKVGISLGTLRPVRSYQYDVGGVGDSNLTRTTLHPSGSDVPAAGEPRNRVTEHYHDWRNREVASKTLAPDQAPTSPFYPPITYCELDNLDRCVLRFGYDGTNFNVNRIVEQGGTAVDVPSRPTDPNLTRAKAQTLFDTRGRVYRTQQFNVAPVYDAQGNIIGATVGADAIVVNNWYDHRDNVLKTASGGKPVTKMRHDGAGRMYWQFISNGGGDMTWDDAGTVFDDVVLEEVENQFDSNGNLVLTTSRLRHHNAPPTGTGELPFEFSRWSYVGNYYDPANRLTQTVNLGTNGGERLDTRPPLPARYNPDGWDTFLRTDITYDDGGWTQTTVDPRGVVTHRLNDTVGRVLTLSEAYGSVTSPRFTRYIYDGLDRVTLVEVLGGGGIWQGTAYQYGVTYDPTAFRPSYISSNDLLREIWYPDPVTGMPSSNRFHQEWFTYNGLGERITMYQRAPTLHRYTFDQLGRMTVDWISDLAEGFDGNVRKLTFEFESFGNARRFRSLGDGDVVRNDVIRQHDGFGQVRVEYLKHDGAITDLKNPPPATWYTYDQAEFGARPNGIIYPNGRFITYVRNAPLDFAIGRITWLSDSNPTRTVEEYQYLGLSTIVERHRPTPNVTLSYVYQPGDTLARDDSNDQYTGFDRFGRVIDQYWFRPDGPGARTDRDRYQYAYDAQSNRLYRNNMLRLNLGELYHANRAHAGSAEGGEFGVAYDLLGRVKKFQRGTLAAYEDRLNEIVEPNPPSQDWTLDPLGNWTRLVDTTGPTPVTYDWTYDAWNKYTTAGYTANGNGSISGYTQANGPTRQGVAYDGWNRIVAGSVLNGPFGNGAGIYQYDALGRLIRADSSEDLPNQQRWLYNTVDGQLLAEYTKLPEQAPVFERDYVWGLGYTTALAESADVITGTPRRISPLQDANWNVTAILVGTALVERYAYSPYGNVRIMDSQWVPQPPQLPSVFDWRHLNQGQRVNLGDGLYLTGPRVHDTFLGRWMQQDPAGYQAGMNRYEYNASSPASLVDPTGEFPFLVVAGALLGIAAQGVGDVISGKFSGWEAYVGAAVGGALTGLTFGAGAGFILTGMAGSGAANVTTQVLRHASRGEEVSATSFVIDTALGGLGGLIGGGVGQRVFRATLPTASRAAAAFIAGKVGGATAGAAVGAIAGGLHGGLEGILPGAGRGAAVGWIGGGSAALLVTRPSFKEARAARDATLAEIARLPVKQRNRISTVVGGVHKQTGQTAVGIKRSGENFGMCAEDLCVEQLGGSRRDVLMSEAIRPRTNAVVPVCRRCQTKYTREQFPPGTPFEE